MDRSSTDSAAHEHEHQIDEYEQAYEQEHYTPPFLLPSPPLPPTLTDFFLHENFVGAARHMRLMDLGQARVEIPHAFKFVATAPSWFLLCIHVWVQEGTLLNMLGVVENAVLCIRAMQSPLVSTHDSELAGSLLFELRECRTSIIAGFAIAYRVSEGMIANFCDLALRIKAYNAIQLMHALHMTHLLPVERVLLAVIEQDDMSAGDLFVRRNKEHQHLYVNMLLQHRVADKLVKKRITDFKLDPNAFPDYVQRKKLSALRYLIYSEQYEEVEKFIHQSADLQIYTCQILIEKRGITHPVTQYFVRTTGLAHVFPFVDVITSAGSQLPKQDDYEELDSCLSLAACIGTESIVFVDTMEGLKSCLTHLEKQSVIGFDCEWKATHVTPRDIAGVGGGTGVTVPNPCATLQLASLHKAFVIDIIALNDISDVLSGLFVNDEILKLGFDTNGDLKLLRAILGKPHGGHEVVVSNLLDVQAVVRKLYAQGAVAVANGNDQAPEVAGNVQSTESSVQSAESSVWSTESSDNVAVVAPEEKLEEIAPADTNNGKAKRHKDRKRGGAAGTSENAINSLALTGVAQVFLGKPLDKRARMSNWERRPLTRAQLHYAALDAQVLVQILAKIQQQIDEEVLEPILKRCTQKNIK